jgi:restriction system protein
MGRKDDGLLELLADCPWWVSVILAAVLYVLMAFVVPVMRFGNPILDALAPVAPKMAWMVWIFLLPAGVSAFRSLRKRRQLDVQSSLDSIRSLSWKQFEELIAEACRRRGYSVRENSTRGADGGTDVHVIMDGRLMLVQCKHWRERKVGVNVVREMLGLVTAHKASGAVIMTTGSFTKEAEAFASGQPVDLYDGARVLEFVQSAQGVGKYGRPRADWGSVEPLAPQGQTCPRCGGALVLRKAKRGGNAGTEFWGCSGFPQCRYTRDLAR